MSYFYQFQKHFISQSFGFVKKVFCKFYKNNVSQENINQEMINVKLNTSGPKLNSWKAQSLIRALAPIQSDERAKSEPDLWFTKLIEQSQPAVAPGVWLELAPN